MKTETHCLFILKDSCENAAVPAERPVTHFADKNDKSDSGELATGNLCYFYSFSFTFKRVSVLYFKIQWNPTLSMLASYTD